MNPIERTLRRVDHFQRTHRPVAIVFGVIKKFGDDRAGSLAALIAYYAFLSIFPLLLLLTTVLGYAMEGNAALRRSVIQSALGEFPIVGQQLDSAIQPLRGSAIAVVAGLVGVVWGAVGVTQAGQHAMAEIWNVPDVDRPSFLTRQLRSIGLFGVLGLGLAASTVSSSLPAFGTGTTWAIVAFLASIVANIALYLLAFRVLTVPSVPTRALWPGAILGGVAWSVLQLLGSYLVGRQLRHASQLYGYFASVLGLISWLFLGAQIALYAAEVNVVWARRLWPRSMLQPPLTDADKRAFDDIALQGERRPEQSVTSTWQDEA